MFFDKGVLKKFVKFSLQLLLKIDTSIVVFLLLLRKCSWVFFGRIILSAVSDHRTSSIDIIMAEAMVVSKIGLYVF